RAGDLSGRRCRTFVDSAEAASPGGRSDGPVHRASLGSSRAGRGMIAPRSERQAADEAAPGACRRPSGTPQFQLATGLCHVRAWCMLWLQRLPFGGGTAMDVAGRLPANFVNESALRRDPDPSALDARSGGNPAPAVRSGQVGAPVSNCFCLPKELPSKDEAAANVRELEASAPDPADYPGGKFSLQYWIDTAAHGWELHCARQLLLEAYKQEAAEGSATTEAIFEAA